MTEQKPEGEGDGGYSKSNWPRYLLIYLLIGGAIYALIYFLFLRDGGLYG